MIQSTQFNGISPLYRTHTTHCEIVVQYAHMKRVKTIQSYQLPIEIAQEGEYFIATCPVWRDCYAQGNSIDEATSEIIAVAASLIELYQEEGIRYAFTFG